jgi:hypothetical protein
MIPTALVLQTVIWFFLFSVFMYSRTGSVYHPFFYYLMFHGLVFVIRPILVYTFDFDSIFYLMRFSPSEGEFVFVLVLTTAGLLVFSATSWLLDSSIPRYDRPHPAGFSATEWHAFWFMALMLGPLALYSIYYNFGSVQNFESTGDFLITMNRDLTTGVTGFTNTTGYLVDAQIFVGTISLMFLWGMRFRLWAFVPLLLYLAERSYMGWGRWTIILTVAMGVLLYGLHRNYRWLPLHIVFIGIPVMLVFQQLGANREYVQDIFVGEQAAEPDPLLQDKSWIERQDGPDFANFDFLAYVVDVVPDKSGTYSYFTQYIQLFTEPVPRILWPGKPYGSPVSLVNLNDYGNFTGWTTSLIGDGWVSFGWLGVIATMALVGYVTARMHRWFWRGEATNFKILTYCVFVPLTILWYRDGGISIAKFILWTIGPILLWQLVLTMLQHSTMARKSAVSKSPSHLL